MSQVAGASCSVPKEQSPVAAAASADAVPSFAAVYEAHVRFVWRTLRRLGVPDKDCDDAVQDVFLVVHRRLNDFRPEAPIKHWLFRITAGIARDHRRTWRRKNPREHALEPISQADEVADSAQASPLDSAERSAAARLIRNVLQALDEAKREVFILSELEQMTAPEIAQVLEIPLNTVYSRLRRARAEFEEALARLQGHHEGNSTMSDLNPTTRALLDLGREGDDPNEHALAQNRRSLNVKLGAAVLGSGVVAGSASKAAAAVGAWSAAKLAVVCGSVILGGVVTLAAIELQRAAPPSHAAVAAPPRATTNQPRESAHASEPRSEADQAVVAEPVAPEPATRAAPSSRAPAPRSIQEELELIRGAQRLLNRNDPRAALAMLNEHAQRFPSGALWEEREASRVFALCKLGNARAARASADTFVRKAPHSPFVDRVRAACQAPSTSGSP